MRSKNKNRRERRFHENNATAGLHQRRLLRTETENYTGRIPKVVLRVRKVRERVRVLRHQVLELNGLRVNMVRHSDVDSSAQRCRKTILTAVHARVGRWGEVTGRKSGAADEHLDI